MIRLELHATNHADLIAKMAEFMGALIEQPKRTRKVAEPAQPSPVVQAAVTDNTASAPAASPPSAEDADGVGASAPAPLTLDDVRGKLMDVNKAKGMDAVKDILSAHGLQKVSGIPEDKFAAVFAAAEKVLA